MEVLSIITFAIGLIMFATSMFMFFKNNKKSDLADGERWGEFKTTLGFIREGIAEIKKDISDNDKKHIQDLAKLRQDMEERDRRMHERINNHLKRDHGTSKGGAYAE